MRHHHDADEPYAAQCLPAARDATQNRRLAVRELSRLVDVILAVGAPPT